jgi:hypothetical protein
MVYLFISLDHSSPDSVGPISNHNQEQAMYAMTEAALPCRRLGHIGYFHGLAGQAGGYREVEPAFPSPGIHVPGQHGLNHAHRPIQASTGGPGKPPESGGASGTGGAGGGDAGNSGGGSGSGGPRDLAKPVNYGGTGGGTDEDGNSQAGTNAGVVGAHGGTDAAAGATPAGTAGSLERAPDVPDTGKNSRQGGAAGESNAPLSPPGRDQSKPDSPLFGDKADAAAAPADGGGSPAAGAGGAGATGLGEVASADNTRNDASTTGGTGITGGGGSSDAGRR